MGETLCTNLNTGSWVCNAERACAVKLFMTIRLGLAREGLHSMRPVHGVRRVLSEAELPAVVASDCPHVAGFREEKRVSTTGSDADGRLREEHFPGLLQSERNDVVHALTCHKVKTLRTSRRKQPL